MAVKAKLKFRGDMPFTLEHKLLTKLGFRVVSRVGSAHVIVEKMTKSNFKPEVLINGELPEDVVNMLIKRCNTVVGHFKDPDASKLVIELRLRNIAKTLPLLQGKYVEDWITRNLSEK